MQLYMKAKCSFICHETRVADLLIMVFVGHAVFLPLKDDIIIIMWSEKNGSITVAIQ